MSLVRLHNVSKYFDSQPVLRNVFFRLNKGDRVGLFGKNGVGKTTTLKLILGHASLDVTQVYMHLAESQVKIQHQRFSPVSRLKIRRRKRGKS